MRDKTSARDDNEGEEEEEGEKRIYFMFLQIQSKNLVEVSKPLSHTDWCVNWAADAERCNYRDGIFCEWRWK